LWEKNIKMYLKEAGCEGEDEIICLGIGTSGGLL
jgi:hypothetical protein